MIDMRSKVFLALTFMLTGILLTNAEVSMRNITNSSFDIAPKAVADTPIAKPGLSDLKNFDILFSPEVQNDTLYVWSLGPYLSKKTLNAATLEPKGEDVQMLFNLYEILSVGGARHTTPRQFHVKLYKNLFPGEVIPGYIGIPFSKTAKEGALEQLYFMLLPTSATENTSQTEIQLTNNDKVGLTYNVTDIITQNGTFYIVYSERNESTGLLTGIYIQGVKAKEASLLYTKPVRILSPNIDVSDYFAAVGFNHNENATGIIFAWKIGTTGIVKRIIFNIAHGALTYSEIPLANDTEDAHYYPIGVFSSSNSSGVIVRKDSFKSQTPTFSLQLFFGSDIANPKLLDIAAMDDNPLLGLRVFPRVNGFTVVAVFGLSDDYKSFKIRSFDDKGSPLGPQKDIAVIKSVTNQLFEDVNHAIWFGYCEREVVSKCYLGKLRA